MEIKRFVATLVGIASVAILTHCVECKLDTQPLEVEYHEVRSFTYITELDNEVEEEVQENIEVVVFRVTAYCPCEICCGEWAKKRPIDENGNPIVVGAAGVELVDRVSVASPLPFGTKVDLDGIGVVEVQDLTAKWVVEKHGENIIDIYMTDHDTAWNFGVKYIEGVILND